MLVYRLLDDVMHTYQCLGSRAGTKNENKSLEWWYMPGINKENMSELIQANIIILLHSPVNCF